MLDNDCRWSLAMHVSECHSVGQRSLDLATSQHLQMFSCKNFFSDDAQFGMSSSR
jgi:hypothetical protein